MNPKEEKWVDIVGYEDLYAISDLGRVYNKTTKRMIGAGQGPKSGYILVGLMKDGEQVLKGVGRLVAQHFLPNPDNLPLVVHKNGDKKDNRVENLVWARDNDDIVVNLRRETNARKYGIIICIKDGEVVTARSAREAAELTGVPKSTVIYAIKAGSNPKGWNFTRVPEDNLSSSCS